VEKSGQDGWLSAKQRGNTNKVGTACWSEFSASFGVLRGLNLLLVCIDRAPTDFEQKITKKRKGFSDGPAIFVSLVCFCSRCPRYPYCYRVNSSRLAKIFSGSLRNSFIRGRLSVCEFDQLCPFSPSFSVVLCPLRYQRNPRSKLLVAAEPRWVIRG
jgi:hypothetical protein